MSSSVFFLMAASALLHALWNLAARRASGNIGAVWLGLCLASAASAPFAAFFWTRTCAAFPYIAATGLLNALAFGALTHAYEEGEISLVYPVARGTGLAGAALAARWLLGETFSVRGGAGIALICLGIAALALGRPGQGRSLSLAFGVGAALAGGLVIDKLGVAIEHPAAYIFGEYACAAAFLAPYVWTRFPSQCRDAWRHLALSASIGLGSILSYVLALFAFRAGPLGYTAAVREMSVVAGSLLGFFVFKEACPPRKAAGIAAVAAGLVLIKLVQ